MFTFNCLFDRRTYLCVKAENRSFGPVFDTSDDKRSKIEMPMIALDRKII